MKKKRLSKKDYENRKYLKSQEKHRTDKTRQTRASINRLYDKWAKEDQYYLTKNMEGICETEERINS